MVRAALVSGEISRQENPVLRWGWGWGWGEQDRGSLGVFEKRKLTVFIGAPRGKSWCGE